MQDRRERITYLVETYSDMVYRLAVTRVRNPHDAEDIVQKVFFKLIKHIDSLETEEHVKAWLIHVTVNEGKKLFSSAWKRRIVSLEDTTNFCVQPREIVDSQKLMESIFHLPEKYRIVIHLYYFHELSTEEIARILGRSSNTVRSQLTRAREKMRQELKEVFDDVRYSV